LARLAADGSPALWASQFSARSGAETID